MHTFHLHRSFPHVTQTGEHWYHILRGECEAEFFPIAKASHMLPMDYQENVNRLFKQRLRDYLLGNKQLRWCDEMNIKYNVTDVSMDESYGGVVGKLVIDQTDKAELFKLRFSGG